MLMVKAVNAGVSLLLFIAERFYGSANKKLSNARPKSELTPADSVLLHIMHAIILLKVQ